MRLVPIALLATAILAPVAVHAQAGTVPLDSAHGPIVFSVHWRPHVDTAPASLSVHFETARDYSCLLRMTARVTKQDSVVTLGRFRIQAGGICPAMIGPASGGVSLPLDPGRYVLELSWLGRVERWGLSLTEEAIRLEPRGTTGLVARAPDTLAWVAPARSFVLRCGSTIAMKAVCAELYRAVDALPGLRRFAISPVGRNPFGDPASGGTHHVEPPRYYRYATDADRVRAVAVMRAAYARLVGERTGCTFGITTADGRTAYGRRFRNEEDGT
jgi:hypothetical protein